MTRLHALAVVIPVRDEQERIGACLVGVRRALDAVGPAVATVITVVLDRCRDRTPQVVAAHLAGWPGAVAVVAGPGRSGAGVGALRDLGVRDAMARLGTDPARTWLLGTDGDTTVPPDWALAHLRAARDGAVGVAGLAELDDPESLGAAALIRYRALLGRTGRHVYAANLGVRADAYLAVGGYPPDGPGEDHGLWDRLRDAGHLLHQPGAVAVRTSARRRGRAAGGLADLLRGLSDPVPVGSD